MNKKLSTILKGKENTCQEPTAARNYDSGDADDQLEGTSALNMDIAHATRAGRENGMRSGARSTGNKPNGNKREELGEYSTRRAKGETTKRAGNQPTKPERAQSGVQEVGHAIRHRCTYMNTRRRRKDIIKSAIDTGYMASIELKNKHDEIDEQLECQRAHHRHLTVTARLATTCTLGSHTTRHKTRKLPTVPDNRCRGELFGQGTSTPERNKYVR